MKSALQIIDALRELGADLRCDGDDLVVKGRGEPLPDELKDAIRDHKSELLIALGAPREVSLLHVLSEMRPHLPPSIKSLPDSSLLALVNWSMLHAWNRAASQIGRSQKEEPPAPVRPLDESEQGEFFREDRG